MRPRLLIGIAFCLTSLGCGGTPGAVVSGQVTLNGAPLADATISFTPIGDNPQTGPGSIGKTDAQGRYTLKVVGSGKESAFVGPNRVQISAFDGPPPDSKDDNPKPRKDRVPDRYNSKSDLTFDVLKGGTSSADFKLTTP